MITRAVRVRPFSDWRHESEAFQDQNDSLKIYPYQPLSYTITKKPKRVNLRQKSHWGSWSSWGSPLIALPLGLTIIRVLSRFLIERILFRLLSNRVFLWVVRDRVFVFRVPSNRFFSSLMLFFHHVTIFLSNRVTTFFYQKQMFCFAFIIIIKNN